MHRRGTIPKLKEEIKKIKGEKETKKKST